MTNMHREAFERVAKANGFDIKRDKHLKEEYAETATHFAFIGWQAALCYRDEQDQTGVWRCYKEYMSGDGGRVHSEKFAKTKADMLIFKSQGYDCEKLSDEQEKQA